MQSPAVFPCFFLYILDVSEMDTARNIPGYGLGGSQSA
jgi:hypothetical protein